ncbi:hypothetical protein K4F52_003664 [Lecanicillium sp. MT-2017a]|nr:hypothetical protein K4F52_003664 [Lecanicillium sp. MT-2017a]
MNAHALLSSQGWRGKGHSLHKTDDAIGLAKPLLLNRKDNTKGLGATQHFTSDQWWMNAFDEQLQGLDTSKKGHVTQTVSTGKLNSIEQGSLGKYSLYTSFVRGGLLQGTISSLETEESTTSESEATADDKKLNSKPSRDTETKEERRARKEAKRKRRDEKAKRRLARKERKSKSDSSDDTDEEKKRRRARKEEKRRRRKEKENKEKSK